MSPKYILIILSLFFFLQNCQSKDCACGRINSGRRSNNRIVNGDRRSSNRIVNGDRKSNNRIVNGDRRSNNRVVNGEEVNPPHKYPWMVYLPFPGCGGSLISSKHVLTAAHCVPPNAATMFVTLGVHDKNNPNNDTKRVKVLSKHIHKDWSGNANNGGDVAILTLATPVKFNKIISPVCLPSGDKKRYLGRKATVSGWGLMADPKRYPNKLQEVDLQTKKQCPSEINSKKIICAKSPGKSSCYGDSGGPFMVKEKKRFAQIGIVSGGTDPDKKDKADFTASECLKGTNLYTSVPDYKDWIKSIAKEAMDTSCK